MDKRGVYDVVVVGTGIGGASAALIAASRGLRVAIVEGRKIGGTCVNRGCVPTKYLLRISEMVRNLRQLAGKGIFSGDVKPDLQHIMAEKAMITGQVISWYKDLVFPSYGINLIEGYAHLINPRTVKVDGYGILEAKKGIVLATGSSEVVPNIPGLKEAFEKGCAITSNEALSMENVPDSLLVIGGGPIGVELSTVWEGFGSRITIVEMKDRLLPGMDPDVSRAMENILRDRGVEIHTNTTVTRVDADHCRARLLNGVEVETDHILVAVGRRPFTHGLGVERVGVRLGDRGEILVNEVMETSVPGIYAVGDVTGEPMIAGKAKLQGIVAGENLAGADRRLRLDLIPQTVFSDPEAAGVGISALKGDPRYIVKRFPVGANYRAIVNERINGIAKIVAEKESGRIVGFHMVGLYASEVVNTAVVAISKGLTIDEAVETLFTHPVISEVFLDAAHLALGYNVYLPRRG